MKITDRISQLLSEVVPIPTKGDIARHKAEKEAALAAAPPPMPEAPGGGGGPAADLLGKGAEGEVPLPGPEKAEAGVDLGGPPPGGEMEGGPTKTERIELRIDPADKAEMEASAKKIGLTLSAYLVFLHKTGGGKTSMPKAAVSGE